MSSSSNDQGRAYEFAWINALCERLSQIRNVTIVNNSSYHANERSWNLMNEEMQQLFIRSAYAAVDTILELEPIMVEINDDEVLLEFQRDGAGIEGDVRDIVIKRNDIDWEVGLSIKHNHEAVKHSRLSHRLDFGMEWFGMPCSQQYWNDIEPIFQMLSQEKNNGTAWSELPNKENDVYIPLLEAFINEVLRSYHLNPSLPQRMVEYLIGVCDYYKVVSVDSRRMTLVHSFNLHGTLNHPSTQKVSAFEVPIVDLPTELISIRFKPNSTNTVEMYLNNGWELSFRIHNASTLVEPSLKFDIQFIGMPLSILNIECRWY